MKQKRQNIQSICGYDLGLIKVSLVLSDVLSMRLEPWGRLAYNLLFTNAVMSLFIMF